ncbi:MAG: hypothetical protein HQL52_14465 [Magnetococcales bacterium]|nr:hypothetical protein [Magnetococcales bacterium]
MMPLYIITILTGLLLGWLFMVIWRKVLPTGMSRAFWSYLATASRELLTQVDADEFPRLYWNLVVRTFRYSGRNMLAVGLGVMPTLWVLFFAMPTALERYHAQAPWLELYPSGSARLLVDGAVISPGESGEGARYRLDENQVRGVLQLDKISLNLDPLAQRYALCRTTLDCLLFMGLDFSVRDLSPSVLPEESLSYVVVRPSHGDDNLLWPFLSDLEFLFFLSLILATMGSYFFQRKSA